MVVHELCRYSERIVASRTPVFHPDESPLSQESARQMHAENRKRIFSAMGDSIIVIEVIASRKLSNAIPYGDSCGW